MLILRLILSLLLIVAGIVIVAQMLRYPLAQSFTGLVLGGAMMWLGTLRLRQVREVMRRQ